MSNFDNADIVWRMYHAIELLIERKAMRGLRTFTARYGINHWNFCELHKDMTRGIFKPSWLTYLVRDYNVSAHWLLTGEGEALPPPPPPAPAPPKRKRGRPRKNA